MAEPNERDNASFEVAKLLAAHAGDFEASVEAVADLIISEREKARAEALAEWRRSIVDLTTDEIYKALMVRMDADIKSMFDTHTEGRDE